MISDSHEGLKKAVRKVFSEQNDEWAVTRRYMSLETMAGLCNDLAVGTKAIPAT